MEQINQFHKGLISDLDYSKRDNLTWDFPTMNIRVINRKGQGLVVTNIDGNDELFTLAETSPGYYIIGAADNNGILYIASYNPSVGYGELGVYPSPVEWSATNTEFERTYKPLHNLWAFPPPPGEEDQLTDFRTTYFNFDMDHPLDILLKQSYDESIDIYLCDGFNPNRVINSGFKRTGQMTGRTYTINSFDGAINHIPATKSIPLLELERIEGGGMLPPGTYFGYIRYCTQDFARTRFLNISGPMVVYENTTPNEIKGVQDKDWGTGVVQRTNKKLTMKVSNLDPTYRYFEIAILRYSADSENGPAAPHYGLLDQRFIIGDGDDQYITINGSELLLTTNREELSAERIPYDISKSIENVADRYVGANWRMRNEQYDIAKFAELASLVTLEETISDDLFLEPDDESGESVDSHQDGNAYLYGMRDYTNASKFAGYFHGQIYPFSLQYIFDDNTVTDAFPVKGNINGNTKGLFRFTPWASSGDPAEDKRARHYALGIKFNFSGAKDYYDANSETFKNVIGFRLLRGDRIDNLIGQGIVLPTYDSLIDTYQDGFERKENQCGINNEGTEYDAETAYAVPMIFGFMPFGVYTNEEEKAIEMQYFGINQSDTELAAENYYWWGLPEQYHTDKFRKARSVRRLDKFGIFMPDLLFEQNPNIPDDVYIEPVLKVSPYSIPEKPIYPKYTRGFFWPNQGSMKTRITPQIVGLQHKVNYTDGGDDDLGYSLPEDITNRPAKATFVDRFEWKSKFNLKSWFRHLDLFTLNNDGTETLYRPMITNRSFVTNRYIGVYTDSVSIEDCLYGIVNVYKNKNDGEFAMSILQSFSVASQLYRPISGVVGISSDLWTDGNSCFQGDCYYNKTWFRHGRWYSYDGANVELKGVDVDYIGEGRDFVDNRGSEQRCWQYGSMLGIITENKYNTAARNNVKALNNEQQEIEMTFFPKCISDYGDWIQWLVFRLGGEHEALQINNGYHQPLSEKYIQGYDSALITTVEYRKTNRHYFSEKHVLGSFIDGWRDIKPSYYKDFAPELGEIIAVRAIGNYMASVLENAILRHFIDDRELQPNDDGTRVILGASYSFLSDNFIQIASYGSLHKHGLVKSDSAVYGVDMKRGIIWRFLPVASQTGMVKLVAEDLTEQNGIKSWMESLKKNYIEREEFGPVSGEEVSDAMSSYVEMMYGNGLSGGWNKKFKEVYLSFFWTNKIGDNVGGRTMETIIFSEELGKFIGTTSFCSMMYINLDTEFLSVKYSPSVSNSVYIHDVDNKEQEFYGEVGPMQITIVVVGLTGDGSLSKFEKIFEALQIIMNKVEISQIDYETEGQRAIYEFKTAENDDNDEFWLHSEYQENAWLVPIIFQTHEAVSPVDYDIDSEVRGKYLKMTITYTPSESAQKIIMRSITTAFNISTI